MTSAADEKLARIYRSLKDAGIDVLVMGGHAVRYYVLAELAAAPDGPVRALSNLRSRRGFDRCVLMRLFGDVTAVEHAIAECTHPVSYAFLCPLSPASASPGLRSPIDSAAAAALRGAEFNSGRHLALVEVVRRAYKRRAMEIDRADKQARLGNR